MREGNGEAMLRIVDIHKSFGKQPVLEGISLEVPRGQVSVLLGPSGCGKSTLLRTINGLETFDRGEISVDGLVLEPGHSPKRDAVVALIRRRVGMVFQQFYLFPHLTVLENIMEAPVQVLREPRQEARQRAYHLLERVGLADKAHAYPATLSGGQQQRAAIARALAMNPEVLLMDEPTSALDPQMAWEVVRVIADLATSGQTMLIVTHAMHFARQVAHQVHVMCAGRIIESGPVEQIFAQPQQEWTRRFLQQSGLA
ncbi:MAG: arginine ABC transporter ATP-binding protein [Pirellulaceae bacterium]|nr:MAG: arginine ABC transporter ATP-binding protein [Pirellulaceae bacterium]